MTITWGISANSHDAAIAVFDKSDIKFASQAERFSGVKNDANLNKDIVDYAKSFGEPDKVVWYENPYKKSIRQLVAGQGIRLRENNIKRYLNHYGINAPTNYVDHHYSHAAGGYFTSELSHATVICIDSIGEFNTLTVWQAHGTQLKKVYSQNYPHSIGLWYSAMTQRVGLKPNEDEYILMGMAAYGDPDRLYQTMYDDFIYCDVRNASQKITVKQNLHAGCEDWQPQLQTQQDYYDIAAATQKIYQEILQSIVCWTKSNLPSNNLVLTGGCALNCSANSILHNIYDNIWIMPNPGDAGSAVGAVLAERGEHINWASPFLGYSIERPYPVESLVNTLSTYGIAGVANGAAEFGPRALGNRSLLADPRGNDIKHRVNDIKLRQQFRPFAPAILEEYAHEIFQGECGPYMQYTAVCKYPERYPAIVHKDGTSRVQTVGMNDNLGFRKLLESWHRATGCPLLLNTSLNIKGQPIVNDEVDAHEFSKFYNVPVF